MLALQRRNSAVGIIQPLGPLLQENKSLLDPRKGLVFVGQKTHSKVKPRDVVLKRSEAVYLYLRARKETNKMLQAIEFIE